VVIIRLSSLIHRSPLDDGAGKELQKLSTPSGLHSHALLGRLSSVLPHSRLNADPTTEPQQPTTPSGSRSDMHIGCLYSLFRSPPAAHQKIEPVICSRQTTTTHCSSVLQLLESDYIYAGIIHYSTTRARSFPHLAC
jgi:hypothetical protein